MIQREWKEITTEFFGCVKELKLGELIHDNMFGLFDAMSAIEMMDPKMDAGMCCNKEATPLNFQTAVEVSAGSGLEEWFKAVVFKNEGRDPLKEFQRFLL